MNSNVAGNFFIQVHQIPSILTSLPSLAGVKVALIAVVIAYYR